VREIAVGHTGLAVLHADLRLPKLCVRTVASALQRLKALGILHWVRRCAERWADGRFVLEQETNAYAVLPETAGAATGHHRSRQGLLRAPGAIRRRCCLRSPKRRWRAIWRASCRRWLAPRRTAWRLPWRGWAGHSWPATREFSRSAADAEKPSPEIKHTDSSRFGSAKRRKEDASNKRRPGPLVPRIGGC
jgi:hypothetical protein